MGCDGGTIPKRKEVVKKRDDTDTRERKKQLDEAERWKTCAMTDWALRKPIVASPYGYLLSKEEILTHLLESSRDELSANQRIQAYPDVLSPIHSMKDIKDLNLKENPNKSKNQASTSADDGSFPADYVCPITGLETNGKYTFVFSWRCGCVVSERAIKEVPNDSKCLVCQKPYKAHDLVQINPRNRKELKLNQAKFVVRKMEKVIKNPTGDSGKSSTSTSQESKSSASSFGSKLPVSTSISAIRDQTGSSSNRHRSSKNKRDASIPRDQTKRKR